MELVLEVFKQTQQAQEEEDLPTEWLQKEEIYLEQLALLSLLASLEALNLVPLLKLSSLAYSNSDLFLNLVV
jgi:hypothetical protein